MNKRAILLPLVGLVVFGTLTIVARSQEKAGSQEQERTVTEKDVPPAALRTLKALAGDALLTEFPAEIEDGHTFYEGSWKRPFGNVDALVTESGDIVEMEEIVPANMVPLAVRTAAENVVGRDAKLTFGKKTMILYEVHFKKDGKGHEMILTPDARPYHEEGVRQHQDADETMRTDRTWPPSWGERLQAAAHRSPIVFVFAEGDHVCPRQATVLSAMTFCAFVREFSPLGLCTVRVAEYPCTTEVDAWA